MTATYWKVGRRIVEFEQGGEKRVAYGEEFITRLAADLDQRLGRGFSHPNLSKFRQFYLAQAAGEILSTLLRDLAPALSGNTVSAPNLGSLAAFFPLPWSHYSRLLTVKNARARRFYEAEARHGGWSVRQPDRQIDSMFYERTALSKNKVAMLTKGVKAGRKTRSTPRKRSKTLSSSNFSTSRTNTPNMSWKKLFCVMEAYRKH